jgi:uncharacterized membrane-anchored protein
MQAWFLRAVFSFGAHLSYSANKTMASLGFVEHPSRDAVLAELHARPLQVVDLPARVRRLVFTTSLKAGSMRATIDRYRAYAGSRGYALAEDGARQYEFVAGGRRVIWEFHTEFITVTWYSGLSDMENWPEDIGLDLLTEAQLIGATRVDMVDAAELPPQVFPGFDENSLCLVSVEYEQAQLATDFVPDRDKFIRFEFAAKALSPLRQAIMLRRILEIETYRTMALLALPLARETAPHLRALETQLTTLVEDLSALTDTNQVKDRLHAFYALSVGTGQMSERLGYRFAASRAYGAILEHRLEKLREKTLARGHSLGSFIENRVEPALATCAAMETRLSLLSGKIASAVDMLDVRISLDIQIQNKAVLETIAETARSQFRLQHTVEGLSIIAITYYLLGILGYALPGPLSLLGWDKTLAISIAAPLALVGVWLAMRGVRRRHDK